MTPEARWSLRGAGGLLRLAWPLLAGALLAPTRLCAVERPPAPFEVGLARSCFANVNINDAVAAYRVFLENVGRHRGYALRPQVTVYEDTAQLEAAIAHTTVHFVVMDTWQFLGLEHRPEIRPCFVPAVDGKVGRKFIVLARADGGIRSFGDLRGRTVLLPDTVNNNVLHGWLESLLPADAPADPAQYFAALDGVAKPTAAMLPVFFGQKDACVVDEATFNLMKELNPQVGAVLRVVAASEQLADYVICLGERNWISAEAKADTMKALGDLGADPAGRQMLALFRVSGLVPFEERLLAPARALRRHHDELLAARPRRGEAP